MRRIVRDVIGRALYATGLTLCGIAGWWDAGTDNGRPLIGSKSGTNGSRSENDR